MNRDWLLRLAAIFAVLLIHQPNGPLSHLRRIPTSIAGRFSSADLAVIGGSVLLVWAAIWNGGMYLVGDPAAFHDFGRFYHSAVNWRDGVSMYAMTPATFNPRMGMHMWNLNPPWLTLVFWPFSGLPLHHAVLWWYGVTALCLIGAAAIIWQEIQPRLSRDRLFLLGAFTLAAVPTISFTFTGHLTGPVALLLTWIWQQMRRGHAVRAAMGIGVAIAIRMFFAPLVAYLLFTKQWRALIVALSSLAGCAVVSISIFGWAEHVAWIEAMREVHWPWPSMNASITGVFSRLALDPNGFPTAAMPRAVLHGLMASAVIGFVGLIGSVSPMARSFDQRWLLLLATCLLAFPVGWVYYWWILAGPLAASWSVPSVRRAFWLSLPAWLVPWGFLKQTPYVWITALTSSLYCWGLISLWVGALVPMGDKKLSKPM